MNEACVNLSCLQHGADPRYLRLHAQTQQQNRYYVKHACGISSEYNQFTSQHPWYGAGQGTGDAASRWVVQSHLLITAYHSEAHVWDLSNPITHISQRMGIDAYMDDMNQILGTDQASLLATVLPNAQTDIDLWQGLIQASGGMLNPSKSSWTPFKWTFDNTGNAHLQSPPDLPQYHITASDRTGMRHTIVRNTPSQANRVLGVHLAADRNYSAELSVLKE